MNSKRVSRHPEKLTVAIICILLSVFFAAGDNCAAESTLPDGFSPWLGGSGGLYLYAGTGELRVEIAKQDLNIREIKTHLRAVLFGPDRKPLDEQWIDDDGQGEGSGPGAPATVQLSTTVTRPGVYGVMIMASEDRYGDNISWAFKTNCPRYLVEISRGHKDSRHLEPIILRSPDRSGDIAFIPGDGPFSLEVSGLAKNGAPLTLFDSSGTEIAKLPVSPEGAVQHMGSGAGNGAPLRLHLSVAEAQIEIDGITRWERGEANENLSLWSTEISSWFPFHENRWLLFPYSRTVYGDSGETGSLTFTVHNNGSASKNIALSVEFENGEVWPAKLSTSKLTLAARKSEEITLSYTVPDSGERKCYIRASVDGIDDFSTWSSVTVRKGSSPAESPLAIPLKLEPYQHENEQFGFLADYPLDNQVYFSPDNQPFIASTNGIWHLNNKEWVKVERARHAVTNDMIPIRNAVTKIAFDGDGDVYTVGRHDGIPMLLHSSDNGTSYTAWPLPGTGNFDIETFSGHNHESGPPPLARYIQTASDPNLIWRRINDLDLFFPEKALDGSIKIGEPVEVSKLCIGLSVHSGIPGTIVSRGDKVHITWGEATDPKIDAPGVPTFVATYDRTAKTLSDASLIGYGPPANDIHNTPCITMDSKGYLHVLIGTHGRAFKYSKSLKPNTGAMGWSETTDTKAGLRQTYIGMVTDKADVVHTAFRLWLNDRKYYPAGYYANLAFMSKRDEMPWTEARPLVVAPFSEYSIFYHRLSIDRRGRLFLSYDYWSTFWYYRNDHRGSRRSLMMSEDSGESWRLVPSSTFMK